MLAILGHDTILAENGLEAVDRFSSDRQRIARSNCGSILKDPERSMYSHFVPSCIRQHRRMANDEAGIVPLLGQDLCTSKVGLAIDAPVALAPPVLASPKMFGFDAGTPPSIGLLRRTHIT
jgi:hypothetical protein